MKAMDLVKALGVAVATLAITLLASFPMVAFYAFFIEPGQVLQPGGPMDCAVVVAYPRSAGVFCVQLLVGPAVA